MQYKKNKRQEDKDYKKYIKSQPCIVGYDCMGDISAHHVISVGAGGSDYQTVPLCVKHHIPGVHTMGKATFQAIHGLSFNKEIIRLLTSYIIALKGGL